MCWGNKKNERISLITSLYDALYLFYDVISEMVASLGWATPVFVLES